MAFIDLKSAGRKWEVPSDLKEERAHEFWKNYFLPADGFSLPLRISAVRSTVQRQLQNCYYRLKIGDYRLGLKVLGDTVELIPFLHRRDIYRRFSLGLPPKRTLPAAGRSHNPSPK